MSNTDNELDGKLRALNAEHPVDAILRTIAGWYRKMAGQETNPSVRDLEKGIAARIELAANMIDPLDQG